MAQYYGILVLDPISPTKPFRLSNPLPLEQGVIRHDKPDTTLIVPARMLFGSSIFSVRLEPMTGPKIG